MKLVSIEQSRVVHLLSVFRPAGQLFLPEAAQMVAARYSFMRTPTIEDFSKESFTFGIGKFENSQVHELQIYNDGIVVTARSNTNILDRFVDDFLDWGIEEFRFEITADSHNRRTHESAIVVQAESDLMRVLFPSNETLDTWFNSTDLPKFLYQPTGVVLDCDPARFPQFQKPPRFSLERRAGVGFERNIFFSHSGFKTDHHLDLLRTVESIGRGQTASMNRLT